jgi:outer membrane biosynthesis protein TonB
VNTASLLSQELAPLTEQIDEVKRVVGTLEGDLRRVEAELETFAAERQRFDLLQEASAALERLRDLGAAALFWEGLAGGEAAVAHSERLRERIAGFKARVAGLEEKRDSLHTRIDQQLDELDYLYDEVQQAHAREERRQEEFLVEREVSFIPFQPMLMPWSKNAEGEGRFRRALLVMMFWSLALGFVVPMIHVPLPDRTKTVVVIPERMAMLLKQEAPKPAMARAPEKLTEDDKGETEKKKPAEPDKKKPEPEKMAEAKPAEPEKPKPAEPEKVAEVKQAEPEKPKPAEPEKPPEPKPAEGGSKIARKKAEQTGVLAFKSNFSDLMAEVPVAKLGTEARLNKDDPRVLGQARAERALVTIQAKAGSSGGIANYGVSRDLGHGGKGGGGYGYGTAGGQGDGSGYGGAGRTGGRGGGGQGAAGQIGGVGLSKIESKLADLTAEEGRPLSSGPGAGRTDEEIQIVFDRYKATLYRIYNGELRRDPTLRGKMLLRLVIEPDGEVSHCKVESTDLASPELVTKIVARVQKFNFGPKADVPPTTILYPIDFLPAMNEAEGLANRRR